MLRFDFLEARNLRHAIALLERHGDEARPVAGSTDFLVRWRQGFWRPACVVNLKGISSLERITYSPQNGLRTNRAIGGARLVDDGWSLGRTPFDDTYDAVPWRPSLAAPRHRRLHRRCGKQHAIRNDKWLAEPEEAVASAEETHRNVDRPDGNTKIAVGREHPIQSFQQGQKQ